MSPFDHLKELSVNKKETFKLPEDMSGYEPYIMNRILSMVDIYRPVALELSRHELPKEVHYRYLYNILPKRDIFVKYLKAAKQNQNDEKWISRYFESGTRDLEYAMKFLTDDEIKTIKKKFGNQK